MTLKECRDKHLLKYCPKDGSKREALYIRSFLKKLGKMTLRDAANHLKELNGYLPRLPSIAVGVEGATAANKELDQAKLCAILQRMVPKSWSDAFWVATDQQICTNYEEVVDKLECIETAQPEKEGCKPAAKESNKSSDAGGGRKTSGRKVSDMKDVPRKAHRGNQKHCILCKQHGGAHGTHNTKEC